MKLAAFAILIFGLLIAGVARAQTPSHFQQLEQMFNQSAKPALVDLQAAYAGRCYQEFGYTSGEVAGPNDATGALLVGKELAAKATPADDGGPLFPASQAATTTKVNLFNASDSGTDEVHFRFDNWTLSLALQAFNTESAVSTPVSDNGNELVWHSDYASGAKADIAARKSGAGYIVVKALNTNPGSHYPAKVLRAYCYFFKPLK